MGKGVEASVRWMPVPAVDLNANYTYTDAVDHIDGLTSRAELIPREAFNLGARYFHDSGFSFGGNVSYNSGRYRAPPNHVVLHAAEPLR